jgi:hypothetical protein
MKKQFSSEKFHEGYSKARVWVICLLVVILLAMAIKAQAHIFDVELSVPERMSMDRDYEDRSREREQRESFDRVQRDDNPSERDYERANDYVRDRMG